MARKRTKESEVYRYFMLRLTNKEIAKLTDLSERTIQRMIKDGHYKELAAPQPIAEKARSLRSKGLTYVAIAAALKCSKTSVYNYLKRSSKQ